MVRKMPAFIAYFRCSTARQEASGLGLDAQQEAVSRYVNGGKLLASYTEVESGKNNARPQLAKALAHCKRTGATLLIARLDRLGRNVAFLAALMDGDVPFICCDNPAATRLTLHVLSAVAEHEARMISERTKAALAAARARGVRLGGHREGAHVLSSKDRTRGHAVATAEANAFASDVASQIEELKADGASSLAQLAAGLNERGIATRRGSTWTITSVARVLARTA